jgi:hypothetical protein
LVSRVTADKIAGSDKPKKKKKTIVVEEDDEPAEIITKKVKKVVEEETGSTGERLPALMKELLDSVKTPLSQADILPSYYSNHLYKVLE